MLAKLAGDGSEQSPVETKISRCLEYEPAFVDTVSIALHPQPDELIDTLLPLLKQFHAAGQMGAHAGAIINAGEVIGSALTVCSDQFVSAEHALGSLESMFRQDAQAGKIVATGVFYHGIGLSNPGLAARFDSAAKALVALLEHRLGDLFVLVIPYSRSELGIESNNARLFAKPATLFADPSSTPG